MDVTAQLKAPVVQMIAKCLVTSRTLSCRSLVALCPLHELTLDLNHQPETLNRPPTKVAPSRFPHAEGRGLVSCIVSPASFEVEGRGLSKEKRCDRAGLQ